MTTEIERLIVTLEARMGQYQRDLDRAGALTDTRLRAVERRFATASATVNSSIGGMRTALGTIGAYLGARELVEYANTWTRVTRSIDGSEEVFGVALLGAKRLNELASDARVDLEAYSKLYIRTSAAIRDYGFEAGTAEKVTSTLAKALKLGGANASEQASVLLQFSQALQKGKLDGDEFRTVMENAGVVQELLAKRLGVSKGAIVQMAGEGKLQIKDLVGAMVDGGEQVERIFRQMPVTMDEGMTVLNNAVTQYVGQLDKAYGISQSTANAMAFLARNIETVGDAALVAASGLLAMTGPSMLKRAGGLGVAMGAAAGPIGLAVGALTAAVTALEMFGDQVTPVAGQMATLRDYFHAVLELAGDGLSAAFGAARDAIGVLVSALTGVPVSMQDVAMAAKAVANTIVGAFVAAARIIPEVIGLLPAAVAEQFMDMAQRVIVAVQTLANGVIAVINGAIAAANALPGVDIALIDPADLGRLENDYEGAGRKLAEAIKSGFDAGTQDFLAGISDRANELAMARTWSEGTSVRKEMPKHPLAQPIEKAKKYRPNELEREVESIEKRIATERLEAQVVGLSAYEAERLRAEHELLTAAREAGVPITEAERVRIAALSDEYARAVTETDALREAMQELKSTSADTLKGFISDLMEGKSAAEALGNQLQKLADKLIDMAVNKLVEQALGGLWGGSAGSFAGSGIGSWSTSVTPFAKGGVFDPVLGARPLKKFARGGTSREAAIFGEAGPEAAVPLPDGRRIPVDLKVAGGGGAAPQMNLSVAPVFHVQNGTAEGVEKLRTQVATAIPQMVKRAIHDMLDRDARLGRLGA